MVNEGDRVGSNALGTSQIRAFLVQIIQDIRQEHAYIINNQVIEPLVDRKLSERCAVPGFFLWLC